MRFSWFAINFDHTFSTLKQHILCKNIFFIKFNLFRLFNEFCFTLLRYVCIKL